uniref:Glutamyl-tRNA amidotransferase subunit B n=1 Tax=Aegilops tauschii subsp. strangulata TaxID=200361 RepID=A0A453N808_AEGTS
KMLASCFTLNPEVTLRFSWLFLAKCLFSIKVSYSYQILMVFCYAAKSWKKLTSISATVHFL